MEDDRGLLDEGPEDEERQPEEEAGAEQLEAEASEPESQPEGAEPPTEREKTVPLAALMEERSAARQARDEAKRLAEQYEIANRRFEEWRREQEERAEQARKAQQYDEDPLGAMRNEIQRLHEQIGGFTEHQNQIQQQAAAQQEFLSRYQSAADEFTQQQPDFNDAYQHLLGSRVNELQAFGYSKQEAAQLATQEERMLVQWAMQNGKNPAEGIYNLAKQRGYSNNQGQSSGNGAPSSDTFQRAKEGQKVTSRMGGGAAPKGKIDLQALANMSDEEFARMKEAKDPDAWESLWNQ